MKVFDAMLDAVSAAGIPVHGIAAAALGVAAPVFFGSDALPFFGVSVTTLGMSAAGSMIAFAYGTPVESRKKLYGYAIGGTFIGIWSVQILPRWLGWEWYDDGIMEAPLAGAVALASRWIVPLVLENLPALWRRITNQTAAPDARPPGES